MSELEQALALASRVLDKPWIDPDGDICLLARHLLRLNERTAWQPIDSAPTDGTKFLAWTVITKVEEFDDHDNLIARDLVIEAPVIAQNLLGFGVVEVPFRSIIKNREFTHWQPLPAAPLPAPAHSEPPTSRDLTEGRS